MSEENLSPQKRMAMERFGDFAQDFYDLSAMHGVLLDECGSCGGRTFHFWILDDPDEPEKGGIGIGTKLEWGLRRKRNGGGKGKSNAQD